MGRSLKYDLNKAADSVLGTVWKSYGNKYFLKLRRGGGVRKDRLHKY
jgi:hypothetical protein